MSGVSCDAPYDRDGVLRPNRRGSALTESKIDASSDPRAQFVGVEAYISAGGQIERDLFQPEHEGYLTDPAKLNRLTAEKLTAVADEVRGEGWKWFEILPNGQYPNLTKFGRIYPVYVPVAQEVPSEIEALQAEQEKIEEAHQDAEEYPPDVEARMSGNRNADRRGSDFETGTVAQTPLGRVGQPGDIASRGLPGLG